MAHAARGEVIKRDTAVLTVGLVRQPARSLMADDVPVGSYLLNFDPGADGSAELLYVAEESATREALQHVERPFPLCWWLCKKIELPDAETGEARPMIRTVLISPDKETLSFVSVGVVGSLDLLRSLKGDGPYDPAVPVLVRMERTRGGFNMYRLRPVFDGKSDAVAQKK